MSLREVSKQQDLSPDQLSRADDAVLVAAYQADPEGRQGRRAVSQLLGRYRRLVLQWCGRYVRDREGAMDLAQDVLLSAFRHLDSYSDKEKFSAWLFIITRNRCLSELRKGKVSLAGDAVLELLADPGRQPDAVLEQKLAREDLDTLAARTLTSQEWDALWLRCYEAMPVDLITRRLGLQEKSGARGVLQRARRKLRRALEVQGQEEQGGGE